MKTFCFVTLYIVFLLSACSISDVLKPSNQINISLMETVDTVKAVPGADITFKFVASSNFGMLTRIEILETSHEFEHVLDSMRFALVDQNIELSIDSLGFLSRPVSTLMALFPLKVPIDEAYVGKTLSIRFRISDNQNNTASVRSCFKIVNLKNNDWLWLYRASVERASFYGFASTGKHEASSYFNGKEKEIDVIVATNADKKTFVLNPHASSTEIFMNKMTYYTSYKATSMRNTVFLKLNDFDFEKVDDQFIEQLDFSTGSNQLELHDNDMIAFKNQDGKKGVIHVKLDMGYKDLSFRSLIQIVPK